MPLRTLPIIALSSLLLTACVVDGDDDFDVGQSESELFVPLCYGNPTYYVDDGAAFGGSGSSTAPFRTIHNALTAARSANACSVTVVVSPGYYYGYWGTLGIDRQTTIRGTSRTGVHIRAGFYNASRNRLRVESATIENATRPAVRAIDSRTELSGVTIRATYYAGVDQTGGTLDVRSSAIYDLRGESTAASAPAISVKGGASAVLRNVNSQRNPQGLVASGAGTYVDADALYVYYTDRAVATSCDSLDGHAAIAASDGAVIAGRRMYVYQTQGAAFHAYDGGVLSLDTGGAWQVSRECPDFGSAAARTDDGVISLAHFTLSGGGYGVLNFGADSDVELWDGEISLMMDAAICGMDPSRMDAVTLTNNAADYCPVLPSGAALPPPTPAGGN